MKQVPGYIYFIFFSVTRSKRHMQSRFGVWLSYNSTWITGINWIKRRMFYFFNWERFFLFSMDKCLRVRSVSFFLRIISFWRTRIAIAIYAWIKKLSTKALNERLYIYSARIHTNGHYCIVARKAFRKFRMFEWDKCIFNFFPIFFDVVRLLFK